MKNFFFLVGSVFFIFLVETVPVFAQKASGVDTSKLSYPLHDSKAIDFKRPAGLDFPKPSNIQRKVEFDPITRKYIISERIGNHLYRPTEYLTIEEYQRYENKLIKERNWKELTDLPLAQAREPGFIPPIVVDNKLFQRIFGGTTIDIRPQVSAEVILGGRININNNPILQEDQRKQFSFDFNQRMQANVTGQVGNRMRILLNYNTEAQFDFENQVKVQFTDLPIPGKPSYEGKNDDIIKKIEAGNVSFPLNTSLITGSQALFGLMTQLQFGRLKVTSVFSQQKSQQREISIANGSQQNTFRISADAYEANKHYFLSQYFRDNYNKSLEQIPTIASRINILKVEVWITNKANIATDARDILALTDLGENEKITNTSQIMGGGSYSKYPMGFLANTTLPQSNNLLEQLMQLSGARNTFDNSVGTFFQADGAIRNYAKLQNARKLQATEFTLNNQLGYISLNTSLNSDEVLAVAYQYAIDGVTYQVGEFSTDRPTAADAARTVLFVKLLKNEVIKTDLPIWNLMMKNIYSLNAFQINSSGFNLNIYRQDETAGIDKLIIAEGTRTTGKLWIQLTNLDRINQQNEPYPDGLFDFIEGITIDSQRGKIKFPVLEPFGSDLRARFDINETALTDKYVFQELYTQTQADAKLNLKKDRYTIRGTYQSQTGTEFVLNAINVPQGSVQVFAGTIPLVEGADFTVDYNTGRVKILNQAILSSGQPINIKLENSELFGVQQRNLIASRFEYTASPKLRLGATVMNLTERAMTQKVNLGQEPLANTIWGADVNYDSKSRWLTKMIDKIPLISTKVPSNVTFNAEFAQLIPHKSQAVGGYLDDFESTRSVIDIKSFLPWQISGTPQGIGNWLTDSLSYGYQRARIAFYTVDPIFYNGGTNAPPDINLSNNYVRQVTEQEVFPFKQSKTGAPYPLSVFDVAYYPKIRGPYNYTTSNLAADGTFIDPKKRWGGIMRRIDSNDFDALNVEFIEMWVLDPFLDNKNSSGGDLYFNLGNISEDILKDGSQSLENGLPVDGDQTKVNTTVWGNVPKLQPIVQAFSNDPSARVFQDVGLDGLSDGDEKVKFAQFLNDPQIAALQPDAIKKLTDDPSSDNYHYFRGDDLNNVKAGILQRYAQFNGTEGNSKTSAQSAALGLDNSASTSFPDVEDINRDNTMTVADEYFQYRVSLRPDDIKNIGVNYVANIVPATVKLADGTNSDVNWIQFKIPVRDLAREAKGGVQDLKSVRFIRMYLSDFEDDVVLRFARLQLVRSDWRQYNAEKDPNKILILPNATLTSDVSTLDVSTVSIEENGKSGNVNYVIPPGITRELDYNNVQYTTQMNEQSLALTVKGLASGYGRAAFKNSTADFRAYKRLKLFIHAEQHPEDVTTVPIVDNDLNAFIRFGADNQDNYYEYRVPLKVTNKGATDPAEVWPDQNSIDVALEEFQKVKIKRNNAIDALTGQPWDITKPYTDPEFPRITIAGQPDMSNVQVYMLGIWNPVINSAAKSAVIWFDELRLSEPVLNSGWAAVGRLNAKLADLGNVAIAGNKSTSGFGSVNQRLAERSRNDLVGIDISSNIELGKFFPLGMGIKMPMYVGYSQKVSTPQYDPRNPDLELKTVLENSPKSVQDSILHRVEDYTTNSSINFTNVRKVKTNPSSKNHLWDIENLNATYAFTQYYHRDLNVENRLDKTYRVGLGYNFSNQPKVYTPLSKAKFLKSKSLGFVRDFNFSLMPSTLNFDATVDRFYSENTIRNNDPKDSFILPTIYNKNFRMTRKYGLVWNLSRSVQVDFSATNVAAIDEPQGAITQVARDTIWQNLLKLGRTTDYNHGLNVTYNLPINKLPGLDWAMFGTRYSATFNWKGEALTTANKPYGANFGHTIQNTRAIQLNPSLNMNGLYNKFKFIRNAKDSKNLWGTLINILTSVKNVTGAYIRTEGTFLPGYLPTTNLLGQDLGLGSPGLDFAFGSQRDMRSDLINYGWITPNPDMNTSYTKLFKEEMNFRGILEPIPSLRIELTMLKSRNLNDSENFRFVTDQNSFQSLNPTTRGDFSISVFTLLTAFEKEAPITNASNAFNEFQRNRIIVANRLAENNPNSQGAAAGKDGFPDGYGKASQDVVVPAFIAAFTGRRPSQVSLNSFPSFPVPNWRITYNGLTRLDFFKRFFSSIDLNHTYNSTYAVGGFNSTPDYKELNGASNARNADGNFLPKYVFSQIAVTERFAPLIGINTHLKNNMTLSFEYRKNRSLSLSMANSQMTMQKDDALVLGVGYRTNKFRFPFGLFKQLKMENDLNFRFDFVINDRKTVVYRTDVEDAEVSAGAKNIDIRPSISYVLNKQFNIRIFYTNNITKPYTSQTFDTAFSTFGIAAKFNLQ